MVAVVVMLISVVIIVAVTARHKHKEVISQDQNGTVTTKIYKGNNPTKEIQASAEETVETEYAEERPNPVRPRNRRKRSLRARSGAVLQ